jgi:hypothetical protein
MSARRHFSRMGALFEARATKERVLHFNTSYRVIVFRVVPRSSGLLGSWRFNSHAPKKIAAWLLKRQLPSNPDDRGGTTRKTITLLTTAVKTCIRLFNTSSHIEVFTIFLKRNYFQNAQKVFALVRERRFRALVLQNGRTVVGEIDIRALLCGREISFWR